MNVADRVNPAAFWDHGCGNNALPASREEFRNHSRGATLPLMNPDRIPIRNDRCFAITKRRDQTRGRHSVLVTLTAAFALGTIDSQATTVERRVGQECVS